MIEGLSPPQVRMKKTSRVRSMSRVRWLTPMVACSAIEKGACGSADAAISPSGCQCVGKCNLRRKLCVFCSPLRLSRWV